MYLLTLLLTGGMLMAAAIMDFIKKEISVGFIMAIAAVCIIGALSNKNSSLYDMALGMVIGVLALAISRITHEQIGRGDGLVIMFVGMLVGVRGCFSMVCYAMMFMTFVSVGLIILKKAGRYTKVPFLPALFAGYALYIGDIIH